MDDFDAAAPRSTASSRRLPPQFLVLVLENGTSVFLFLRSSANGSAEFVSSFFPFPGYEFPHPGFHLAVDPTSRYMAIGGPQKLFLVYELQSRTVLAEQYGRGEQLQHVKSCRPRPVNGVIHKMDFLYAPPADDDTIILLLIVIKDGVSKITTYQWGAGQDLKPVLSREDDGHRLPVEHEMPFLLIPLTVRTAFLAISNGKVAVGKDVILGAPSFEDFQIQNYQRSEFHHGRGDPIWTAWTRPYRLSNYFKTRDHIYLAREDGLVVFLDIDSDNILGASIKVIRSQCNISRAFCSLFDTWADILIVGGDSGPGTIWKVSLLSHQ